MKKTIVTNFFLSTIFLLGMSLTVSAQNPDYKRGEIHEKIKAEKIAYFTDKLDLNEEEAKKFWPVFNQYEKEKMEIFKRYKETPKAYASMSDSDADQFLKNMVDIKEREFQIEKEYVSKFRKVLTPKKVAGLYYYEREFKKEVLERVRHRMQRKTED